MTREASLSAVNVRQTFGRLVKAIPGKPIDFITIFCYITTALGELFGRDFGWKWYGTILLLLAVFVAKEVVEPKPIKANEVAKES